MIDIVQSPSPCAIMSSIPLHPSDVSQKGMFLIASLVKVKISSVLLQILEYLLTNKGFE